MRVFETLVVGPLACNCYIVGDESTKRCIVIDPGDDGAAILAAIHHHGLTVDAIIATHAHFDHVLAAQELRSQTGAPFYLHADDAVVLGWLPESMLKFMGQRGPDAPEVDRYVKDQDVIAAGGVELSVIHTPGHTPGSISLLSEGEALFSGDTLFESSIGRTDFPGGDYEAIISSIRSRLYSLEDLPVLPGHGPATSIDREKQTNRFVRGTT